MNVEDALPQMQRLASRVWTSGSWQHPGQIAWSAAYALPEELDHGPVQLFTFGGDVVGWAWAESPDWLELCVDPAHPSVVVEAAQWFLDRASAGEVRTLAMDTEPHLLDGLVTAGFSLEDAPWWYCQHTLPLADLAPVPSVEGYAFRHVVRTEAAARAACHRAAWSPTSKVSTAAYRRLMATAPYRPELDWVAVTRSGTMVASCLVWLDDATGCALVEPVGTAEVHRGRGLAGAVSLAALHAARDLGATTGLVRPRGDDDYPGPQRVYRGIGFRPGPRSRSLVRTVTR